MSEPVSGNHNDLYEIEVHVEEVFATLEEVGIATDGLFVKGGCRLRLGRVQVDMRQKGRDTKRAVQSKKWDVDRVAPCDEKLYQEPLPIVN